jgi:hypothetical protein
MTLTTKCTSLKLVLFTVQMFLKNMTINVSKFGERFKTIMESIQNDRCAYLQYMWKRSANVYRPALKTERGVD